MYNRYIPQQDGTYQKNRIPTPTAPPPPPPSEPQKEHIPEPIRQPHRQPQSATSFLYQLLPKGLDTGDLLIIVLLLLMAGDGKENNSTWLLTLALYLFL